MHISEFVFYVGLVWCLEHQSAVILSLNMSIVYRELLAGFPFHGERLFLDDLDKYI